MRVGGALMVAFQPRIPTKFQNAAGSAEFVFPLAEYSFEFEQGLLVPSGPQTGAHGSFDMLRDGEAPKGDSIIRLSFTAYDDTPQAVEVTVDEMLSKLHSYGRGKLWTKGLDSVGTEQLRWTRGRAMAMPQLSWQGGMVVSKRATVGFRCEPFWYGETALAGSPFTIASNPDTFSITNSGNAPIYNAVIILGGTYTNPVLRNTTNGYQVETATDGSSASHLVRFDAGRAAVEKSTNGGTSYTNDYANYVRASGQVHLMKLDVGQNDFEIEGCSSGTLAIDAYPAWH